MTLNLATTPWHVRMRRRAGTAIIEGGLASLSRLARLHPRARRAWKDVELIRNVPYLEDADDRSHHLDIYRPAGDGPFPVVIYVHGGGFRILSKDTHWVMGLAFARQGYLVFNVNYRLAPEHPYPAAIEDICRACVWVGEHASDYGGDPARLALAGESAGANLVTSVAIADAWERPEPWARDVYDAALRPRVVLPACGILQVSGPERFARLDKLAPIVRDRIEEVTAGYLPDATLSLEERALADPLLWLESAPEPQRPLPAFFAVCGTKDPVLDDSRRLAVAIERLGGHCETRIYPGGIHAFHAFVWAEQARQAWRDQFEFMERWMRDGAAAPRELRANGSE